MAVIDTTKILKGVGGLFKFGTGVLGKSSVLLGIFLTCVLIATLRLHGDIAILSLIFGAAIVVLIWLFAVLSFAGRHPDVAVLEGAEWRGFQQFQSKAKNLSPPPRTEQNPQIARNPKIINALENGAEDAD